jgi:hypothetical protein
MPGKKYSFGQASLMKAIEPGQKALLKFLTIPKAVETEWGQKYSVDILLLSHPLYSIPSPEGIKMGWQTSAKVLKDVVSLLDEIVVQKRGSFKEDYFAMTWELSVAEDGSYWLNA